MIAPGRKGAGRERRLDHPVEVVIAVLMALSACQKPDSDNMANAEESIAPASDVPAATTAGAEISSALGDNIFEGVMIAFDGRPVKVTYRKVGDLGVVGGDMIVGTHAELQQRAALFRDLEDGEVDSAMLNAHQEATAERIAREAKSRGSNLFDFNQSRTFATTYGWARIGRVWPSKVIPFRIGASIPPGPRHDRILAAIDLWNKSTDLKLLPTSNVSPEDVQRIGVLEFVDHDAPDTEFACESWVGYVVKAGRQEVFLNPSCSVGNIAHEIGHALGLEHEHQRTDRDNFLNVTPNLPPEYDPLRGRQLTPHDLCSMMHYAADVRMPEWFTLTAAGQQAFQSCRARLPPTCQTVGQRCQLSVGDLESARRLYP